MLNPKQYICPMCGKQFEITDEWVYRNGTAILCSWHCLRLHEKHMETRTGKTRANEAIYTYGGETKTIREWAKEKGMSYNTLYQRIYRGSYADPFKGVKNG